MRSNLRLFYVLVSLAVLFTASGCDKDCMWEAEAQAFIDNNANKVRDDNEMALPNVIFLVDDTLNNYTNIGIEAISDQQGNAHLNVWLPGCPSAYFEVYAETPQGYVLTTDTRISVGSKSGQTVTFGFAPKR